MEYNRTYTHRTFGHIGSVTLTVPKGEYKINGMVLPESSVTHLLETYALQTLQDAYAGAKSTDEATGEFNKKLDKLLNGTLGTRGSGDGVDERTRVMRSEVMAAAKAKFGAKSPEWATFTGLSDDKKNAKLDAWYAGAKETFDPAIDEEMARRAARRATKAKLAAAVGFTM